MVSSTDSDFDSKLQQRWENEVNCTIIKEQPVNLVSSWILAGAFTLVVGYEFAWSPVLAWLGLLLLMSAIRIGIWQSLRSERRSDDSPRRSSQMLNMIAFIGAIPWGVMGYYFWSIHDTTISAFSIFILGGITAGAMPMMAAAKRMYPIFITTCLSPVVIKFFIGSAFAPKLMGLVMCFYAVFMIRQATRHRNVLWERFRLTAEKDGLIRDLGQEIDNHQKTENKLRQEKERAEQANRAKTDFVTTMSHEIRTPLNSLVGGINLIRGKSINPELREIVEMLDLSSQSLLTIVNDILDFSKIEEGKLDLEHAPFAPSKPPQEVYKLYKAEAEKRGLEFHVSISNDMPPYLMGDANRVRQILLNLVGNAIKFTEQGKISIEVDYQPSNKSWRVVCSDTGIGISPEYRERLFKPFSQADSSMARKFGGSGLGLAICHSLAQAMGGSISLESNDEKGSRFTLILPAEIPEEPVEIDKPENAPPKPKAKRFSGRVMLFEDDPASSKVMSMILKHEGAQVLHAKTGPSGLELLQKEKVDLVLMDLQMPGMDGFETTQSIRQLPDTSATPRDVTVVALTANTTSDIREKCLNAGMKDFLSKPLQIPQLRERLATYLPNNPDVPSDDAKT